MTVKHMLIKSLSIISFILVLLSSNTLAQTTVFNAEAEADVWAWKGDGYVSVMWEHYGEGFSYDVFSRSVNDGSVEKLNESTLKQPHILDTRNGLSGNYEYFVLIRNTNGNVIRETEPVLIQDVDHTDNSLRTFSQLSQTVAEQRQHITTDLEFRNFEVMTLGNIQNFLDNANSFLADYVTEDAFGTERTAAGIIFNAANDYGINPQAILTTLQKEQGLISTRSGDATQYQLDWAMGYAVGNETYRGFGSQVDRAAWQFDKYYRDMETTGTTVSGWGVFIAKETEDCLVITPMNMATAALYTYTPLAGAGWGGCTPFGGNFLYWDLFYNRYSFDAGPEGDFEITEPGDSVGCTVVNKPDLIISFFNTALMLFPLFFLIFKYRLIKPE